MKIKKSELKEIVVEELETYLSELAPCHNPKTGFFDDCDAGAVYSLSEPAVKKAGLDSKYAKKGIVTAKGKTISKFGMAGTSKGCGRKSVSGEMIPKKYSCSKYSQKYMDEDGHSLVPTDKDAPSDRLDKLGYPKHLQALGKGIIRLDEFTDDDVVRVNDLIDVLDMLVKETQPNQVNENNQELINKCKSIGMINMGEATQRILNSLNKFSLAQSGKLYDKPS